MVTETLVKEALMQDMIAAGERLIRSLDKAHFIVSAALWFYMSEVGTWRLIIASPEVRLEGPKKAYKKIQSALAKTADEQTSIQLKDIVVVDSKDPLISLLKVAIHTGEGISGIRFSKNVINGIMIEDAYIYRMT